MIFYIKKYGSVVWSYLQRGLTFGFFFAIATLLLALILVGGYEIMSLFGPFDDWPEWFTFIKTVQVSAGMFYLGVLFGMMFKFIEDY